MIIPMNNKNKARFVESLSKHITNLNKALKNIKLDVMTDFIHINQAGITIVTNKVTTPLDLEIIKRYIKNTN